MANKKKDKLTNFS